MTSEEIDHLVAGASVLADASLLRYLQTNNINPKHIIIHESIISFFENYAAQDKAVGFLGLDHINGRKSAAGRAEIGRLSLIEPSSGQNHFAFVGEQPDIGLERHRAFFAIRFGVSHARRNRFLGYIVMLKYVCPCFFRDFVTTIDSLAAMPSEWLEEKLFPFRPKLISVLRSDYLCFWDRRRPFLPVLKSLLSSGCCCPSQ